MRMRIYIIISLISFLSCLNDNNQITSNRNCTIKETKSRFIRELINKKKIIDLFHRVKSDTLILNNTNLTFLIDTTFLIEGKELYVKKDFKNYHIDNIPQRLRDENEFILHEYLEDSQRIRISISSLYFGVRYNYYLQIDNCNFIVVDTSTYDI